MGWKENSLQPFASRQYRFYKITLKGATATMSRLYTSIAKPFRGSFPFMAFGKQGLNQLDLVEHDVLQ